MMLIFNLKMTCFLAEKLFILRVKFRSFRAPDSWPFRFRRVPAAFISSWPVQSTVLDISWQQDLNCCRLSLVFFHPEGEVAVSSQPLRLDEKILRPYQLPYPLLCMSSSSPHFWFTAHNTKRLVEVRLTTLPRLMAQFMCHLQGRVDKLQ